MLLTMAYSLGDVPGVIFVRGLSECIFSFIASQGRKWF